MDAGQRLLGEELGAWAGCEHPRFHDRAQTVELCPDQELFEEVGAAALHPAVEFTAVFVVGGVAGVGPRHPSPGH